MKLTYIGPLDAVTVGNAVLHKNGEPVSAKDLELTEEQAKALVDRGDFKSTTYKGSADPAPDPTPTTPATGPGQE